jgi:hypothetical protein
MIIKAGTAYVTFVENALTKLENASCPRKGPEDLNSEGTIHKNIAAIRIDIKIIGEKYGLGCKEYKSY